jgi:hypothetical protein
MVNDAKKTTLSHYQLWVWMDDIHEVLEAASELFLEKFVTH